MNGMFCICSVEICEAAVTSLLDQAWVPETSGDPSHINVDLIVISDCENAMTSVVVDNSSSDLGDDNDKEEEKIKD